MRQALLLLGIALVIGCFGCGPRLAQTPLGSEEQKWEKFIKKDYPEWNPPQTIPPGGDEEKAVAKQGLIFEKESVNVEDIQIENSSGKVLAEDKITVAADQKYENYTVQKNDTLWKLAQKFYKDGSKWQKIKEANADVLKAPWKLTPGMKLKIPLP